MTRGRYPTPGELDLWRRMTRDVEPLSSLPVPDGENADEQKPATPAASPDERPAGPQGTASNGSRSSTNGPASHTLELDHGRPINIDRRSWERLKRGQVEIERRLDLHGRTQAEAHDALDQFLTMASAGGLRCVLVVTGKGGVDRRGVLHQMVPRWLSEQGNRDKVLTYCRAQPRHGGDGALYVLLRRRRTMSLL